MFLYLFVDFCIKYSDAPQLKTFIFVLLQTPNSTNIKRLGGCRELASCQGSRFIFISMFNFNSLENDDVMISVHVRQVVSVFEGTACLSVSSMERLSPTMGPY